MQLLLKRLEQLDGAGIIKPADGVCIFRLKLTKHSPWACSHHYWMAGCIRLVDYVANFCTSIEKVFLIVVQI